MSIYFLLEGKRTEPILYPAWMQFFLPTYHRVNSLLDINSNSFIIFSGFGFPCILNHIENAFKDVNNYSTIKHLIICLDSDEEDRNERFKKIHYFITENKLTLNQASLHIIVQHRCIETWLLGNKKIIPRQPQSQILIECLEHFDLINGDPELLPKPQRYNSTSNYHFDIVRGIFDERNISYSKKFPGEAQKQYFLNEIYNSVKQNHLASFSILINTIEAIRGE